MRKIIKIGFIASVVLMGILLLSNTTTSRNYKNDSNHEVSYESEPDNYEGVGLLSYSFFDYEQIFLVDL